MRPSFLVDSLTDRFSVLSGRRPPTTCLPGSRKFSRWSCRGYCSWADPSICVREVAEMNGRRRTNSTMASITGGGIDHSYTVLVSSIINNIFKRLTLSSRNESAPYIYAHTYRKNPSCPSEIPGETGPANDITATFELRSSTYGSYASSNQPRQPIYHSKLRVLLAVWCVREELVC